MKYLVITLSLAFSTLLMSQSILNASSPEEYRNMKAENKKIDKNGDTIKALNDPLPYGEIEEKDELWSKVTWEVIDLNEKINQVYHHQSDGLISSNLSLFDALLTGLKNGEIKEVYEDEYFKTRIDKDNVLGALVDVRKDTEGLDELEELLATGEIDEITDEERSAYEDEVELRSADVEMIMVKGLWYIDKRLGEMKYRLLGIAMLGPDVKTKGRGIEGGDELLALFWIWYPDARATLAKYNVFNAQNNSSKVTYDDLLNARRFSSIIYKSDNGMGEGNIDEYLPKDAAAQLKESERIKNSILEHENQMWNY